jgi:allantoin racemase
MPCPVLGMTEAAALTACMMGGRFGLITFGNVEPYRELIAGHGLSARLAALTGLDATPPEALANPEGVAEKLRIAVEGLAAQGADSVVLAGAALAGFDQRLAGRAALPLFDGIRCGVKLAEALVALNPPRAESGSYAPPQGRISKGLTPTLAALLVGEKLK